MKTTIQLAIVGMILLTACRKSERGVNQSLGPTSSSATSNLKSNLNGQASIELVYYDSMLVKMNLMQLSEQSSENLLAHNASINILYEAKGWVTVTDAIQGDGYNPIWRKVSYVFNSGFPHHQFYSDTEILAAAAANIPEITLTPTNEIYRCDILQHTKIQ
jgi:hypothetical protein